MPEAILKYNLPEEQDDFELAANARKYYSILWDIDNYMRARIKYASEDTPEIYSEAIQMVRDELWSLMNQHNLDLNK
jgi:molecular chaperone GrpE (heat shock protein)